MSYISTSSYFSTFNSKNYTFKGMKLEIKIGLKCKKWILNNGENPLISMVRLAGIEPAHPVPETGALSPEL